MANVDIGPHLVVRSDLDHILNGPSFRCACTFRNRIHLQPVTTTLFGKEQHCIVHRRHIDVFDKVLLARRASLDADSASILCPILGQRSSLDISHV